jgi:hypothetical protein
MIARLALLPVLAAASALATDPCLGSWRLDLARSVYDPGPPPRSITSVYEDAGSGATRVTVQVVPAEGKRYTMTWIARYDGHQYTVFGSPEWDTVEYRVLDPRTVEFAFRRAGKIMSAGRRVLAADGTTYTSYAEGVGAGGRPFNDTSFYVRVRPSAPPVKR